MPMIVMLSLAASQPDADPQAFRTRRWHVSGYTLVVTEARLPTVPFEIVTARLPFRPSYAASVAASKVVVPRFAIALPGLTLRGNSLEIEGQLLQHFGREDSTEVAAAAVLRSGQIGLAGPVSANLAWGNGLSYALTQPRYEIGRGGVRGVDTVQLQYHMSFETEITSARNPRVHYVARLHHRSGIYGVISPSRTGSNYIGVGLRFDLGSRR